MVHLPPQPDWRRSLDRLLGIGIVVLGIIVAIYAVLALRSPKSREAGETLPTISVRPTVTHSATHSPTAHPTTTATASPAGTATSTGAYSTAQLKAVPIVVLNNTSTTGLAGLASSRFTASGWKVSSTGDLVNNILSTCVYYDPSSPENLAAAQLLQQEFPAIKRIEPKFDPLPSGPLIVVLTADYS